jgi:hypothetical protein
MKHGIVYWGNLPGAKKFSFYKKNYTDNDGNVAYTHMQPGI